MLSKRALCWLELRPFYPPLQLGALSLYPGHFRFLLLIQLPVGVALVLIIGDGGGSWRRWSCVGWSARVRRHGPLFAQQLSRPSTHRVACMIGFLVNLQPGAYYTMQWFCKDARKRGTTCSRWALVLPVVLAQARVSKVVLVGETWAERAMRFGMHRPQVHEARVAGIGLQDAGQ